MRIKPVRILAFVAVLITVFAASCSTPEYHQGNSILYYPQRDAYRDEENGVYLVFDSVEQQWTRRDTLEGSPGPAVRIADPGVPVYRDNAQHRLIYGTARFADRDELARKRVEDSLAAVPKLAPPPPPEEAPKRKTRVGRWLEKIFGKKEKQ
ncbi:hypothetical protein EPD60_15400 [Flaviaesturariibacter flavus]|uniref:Uncharacterized protein n=1 Tax=Flaviaesturariibacter flavus TaxID=2502780 RepID=A0A4R1B8U7_9BACT|nr:hypothetical protein [Flaviaesturariibacter flavus]TCJ12649.1 hypothetical protein EPD60_15400 [Flaviaesturariibacter flavus]